MFTACTRRQLELMPEVLLNWSSLAFVLQSYWSSLFCSLKQYLAKEVGKKRE